MNTSDMSKLTAQPPSTDRRLLSFQKAANSSVEMTAVRSAKSAMKFAS
jgi:hypothetical protein